MGSELQRIPKIATGPHGGFFLQSINPKLSEPGHPPKPACEGLSEPTALRLAAELPFPASKGRHARHAMRRTKEITSSSPSPAAPVRWRALLTYSRPPSTCDGSAQASPRSDSPKMIVQRHSNMEHIDCIGMQTLPSTRAPSTSSNGMQRHSSNEVHTKATIPNPTIVSESVIQP